MSDFDRFDDKQLAAHIRAAIAELKGRHDRQAKELAKNHADQIAVALAKEESKKRGRKPQGVSRAAA